MEYSWRAKIIVMDSEGHTYEFTEKDVKNLTLIHA